MPRLKKIEVKEKNTKSKQETLSAENGKTTPQQLGSIIKSARDIMRKDRGLSGDTDRLPQLTWLLFLKFIDDSERLREEEALLAGETFQPAIEAPYRWRDWVVEEQSLTGDDLLQFISGEEVTLQGGAKGKGMF